MNAMGRFDHQVHVSQHVVGLLSGMPAGSGEVHEVLGAWRTELSEDIQGKVDGVRLSPEQAISFDCISYIMLLTVARRICLSARYGSQEQEGVAVTVAFSEREFEPSRSPCHVHGAST